MKKTELLKKGFFLWVFERFGVSHCLCFSVRIFSPCLMHGMTLKVLKNIFKKREKFKKLEIIHRVSHDDVLLAFLATLLTRRRTFEIVQMESAVCRRREMVKTRSPWSWQTREFSFSTANPRRRPILLLERD